MEQSNDKLTEELDIKKLLERVRVCYNLVSHIQTPEIKDILKISEDIVIK